MRGYMGNIGIDFREQHPVESKTEADIKQQIYEKVWKRMKELQSRGCGEDSFCPELNPDVIIISGGRTFLFEPQNARASELLQQCCGSDVEDSRVRGRVRVHPCRCQAIMNILRIAGLRVV